MFSIFALIFILVSLLNWGIDFKNVFVLYLLAFIPILISYVYQFYEYEKIEHTATGYFELDDEGLTLNATKIKYQEINDLKIFADVFHGKTINLYNRYPVEKKSLGINNWIEYSTSSEKVKFYFKLNSKGHLKDIESVIYDLVLKDKFQNLEGIQQIKLIPERFKNSKDYKEFVGRQIKSRKIDCTRGLLLYGYKTYDEAQELKKRYCG